MVQPSLALPTSGEHPHATAGGSLVVPDGWSRYLVPQACAMLARPARSCQSHRRLRRMTDREDTHRSQTKAATDMYQTKHDLPVHTRADVIGIRNARLADSMDRMHQATQAPWHVKRPRCMAPHTRFDDGVDAAEDAMALLAERVVQVGGTAAGTI